MLGHTDRQGLQVHAAEEGALPALARLQEQHPLFERYRVGTAALAQALAAAWSRGDGILVAEQDASLLGFAWWVEQGAFARSPYLRLLVVAAAAVGRGVGSGLMDAVEASAFEHHDDFFLLVTLENDGARRFYARRGFEEVGTLRDYVLPGIHEVIMRKRRPGLMG